MQIFQLCNEKINTKLAIAEWQEKKKKSSLHLTIDFFFSFPELQDTKSEL